MATNIKITALSDITSANMTYNDLVAVVDMNGTPETKKGNLQLVGNLILNGAGGSYFAKAAQATNAETVSNAAQPAITSVGSLTALTVTGNVDAGNVNGTAGVFTYVSGDGANLTNVPAGAATSITDGTSNVDIPTTNGNVTVGVGGVANVLIATTTGVNVTGTLNATGIITGDAGGISNVVYANVTGTPTLGNISTINIDGNVSNVLRGDGTFAADSDTAYGDSNVVTLLNAFGSNTITTTGLITGDGGGISNVIAANISGTINLATFAGTANAVAGSNVSGEVPFAQVANSVTLANVSGAGNIASLNIDGQAANVLYGNGVFAPASSPALTGDGYQLANLTGANVTGEVSFAATANAVAYANVSGTPTLGNISTINIDGEAANVLYGNGVFAAAPGGGSYGDSNVVTLLNAFGSNTITTTGLITGDGGGLSNIAGANVTGTINNAVLAQEVINSAQPNIGSVGTLSELLVSNTIVSVGLTANTGDITVTAGVFAGDGGSISNVVGANVTGEVGFAAVANSVAIANVSGAGNIATVNLDGNTANYLDGTGSWGPVTATTAGTVTTNAQPNITSLGTLVDLDVTGNISGANINANTNGFAIGYKEIPPVVLSANDTIALEDSGKHFRSTTAGNITLSIPTNATVAFPTGTAISIVEQAAGNILVNAISGVTLYQAGNSTAGNRVVSTYGLATLMKVDTDTWFISGTGVS
jgi:hypothetical protein